MKLRINNMSKQYSETFWGIKSITLDIESGIMGLLGPNGAGKSTLMRILATITKPSCGDVFWNDIDIVKNPNALRMELGYLPQDFGVYPNLNIVEFLEYMAAIKCIEKKHVSKRIEELLQVLGLADVKKKPLGSFSGGMKQRVGIAQALLNDPKLLIVDEPTTGLDPEQRANFRSLLAGLSGQRIVILSTHIVSDIEAVASSIAVVCKGNLIKHSVPDEFLNDVSGKVWEWSIPSSQLEAVNKRWVIGGAIRRNQEIQVRIVSKDKPSEDAKSVSPTLEDAYLYYINQDREAKQ